MNSAAGVEKSRRPSSAKAAGAALTASHDERKSQQVASPYRRGDALVCSFREVRRSDSPISTTLACMQNFSIFNFSSASFTLEFRRFKRSTAYSGDRHESSSFAEQCATVCFRLCLRIFSKCSDIDVRAMKKVILGRIITFDVKTNKRKYNYLQNIET